jgi:hypothetical protein
MGGGGLKKKSTKIFYRKILFRQKQLHTISLAKGTCRVYEGERSESQSKNDEVLLINFGYFLVSDML